MAGSGGDRGAMLAVLGPVDAIEATLRDERLDLVIANRNAPRQSVLSGPAGEIARAALIFERKGIATRAIVVSAAFHSRFVAEASGPFLDALNRIEVAPGRVPVFANSTAEVYPASPAETRSLLAHQLARPVRFVEQIEAMARAGVRTFLEVGPDSKLTGLVHAILDGRDHVALALDASRGQRGNVADLARALAQLAAIGHPVELVRWDEGCLERSEVAKKPGLTVKVSGANFAPKPPARQESPRREPVPVGQELLPREPVGRTVPALRPSAPEIPEPPPTMTPKPVNRIVPAPATSQNGLGSDHAPTPIGPSVPTQAPSSFLVEALRASQENLAALHRIGEQTAHLHRQFLEGQDRAQQTFASLLDHQQRLTLAAIGLNPGPASTPAPAQFEPLPQKAAVHLPTPAPAPVVPTPSRPEMSALAPRPVAVKPEPAPVIEAAPVVAVSRASEVHAALVEVVSEKTGYPVEVLEPGMQLDADLGIDSIKRVEILAALQERLPEAPVIGPEHLGTIRTLGQIVEFLGGGLAESLPAPVPVMTSASVSPSSSVHAALVEVVSEKTGYPVEVLEPGMQLDADLGIDSIKRVEILAALQERLPEAPVIGPEHLGTIRTLGQIVEFLGGVSEAPAPQLSSIKQVAASPVETVASEPVRRIVPSVVPLVEADHREVISLTPSSEVWVLDDGSNLTASVLDELARAGLRGRKIRRPEIEGLSISAPPAGLVLISPVSGSDNTTILDAFRLLRAAAPGLRKGNSAFLTVSRLGGSFGFDGLASKADSIAGGLAGLAKTAGHEWPEVHCKAIDLDPALSADRAASAIVEEMARRGPTEVGISPAGRSKIVLRSVPIDSTSKSSPLSPGDVLVITGGARGVTAEVAVALAGAFQPTIAILGRSPAPSIEPDWLTPLVDEAEIKRALHARGNGHSTPRAIGEQFRQVSANREILENLRRIEAAGAKVVYRSVDVRDRSAVEAVVASLRSELGPIRGLIHGAGVLADRTIEDQSDEQFARVFETKVAGLDALLHAIGADDLRTLVLFSSSTARFGRTGQIAYAAANEVLNKRARREAQDRSECRVVSVNWGPWAGGMVTPSLRPLFEAEGIALIPTAEGAKYLVEELRSASQPPVEVVILGGGGPEPEFLKPEPAEVLSPALQKVFERPLDVASTPILGSHVMDGRPVLPMALILEWLAQGAMTRNPGMSCLGVDDLRLLKGVILREALPETIRVLAGKATRREVGLVVPVELRGVLADGREVLHARAEVVLGDRHPDAPAALDEPALMPYSASSAEIYRDVLFHGPDLQGIHAVEGCGDLGIAATVSAAPAPSTWVEPSAQEPVADRPTGDRLRVPDDDPLERRANRFGLVADLRRPLSPVPPGLSGRGSSRGRPSDRIQPAQGPRRRRFPRRTGRACRADRGLRMRDRRLPQIGVPPEPGGSG